VNASVPCTQDANGVYTQGHAYAGTLSARVHTHAQPHKRTSVITRRHRHTSTYADGPTQADRHTHRHRHPLTRIHRYSRILTLLHTHTHTDTYADGPSHAPDVILIHELVHVVFKVVVRFFVRLVQVLHKEEIGPHIVLFLDVVIEGHA
jgi:hypothetical protein